MNKQQIILAAASDLKRVALGIQSDCFTLEAKRNIEKFENLKIASYIKNLAKKSLQTLNKSDTAQKSEECLLYSTLFQNYGVGMDG